MAMLTAHSVKKLLASKPFAIGVIISVSFAVYFNTLWNGFVYDDKLQILGNPWIKDARYLPDIFLSKAWGFSEVEASNYYRPMMHLAYMFAYHVFGLKPWGFHLINVLLHTGISVLVFVIASALFDKFSSSTTSGEKYSAYEFMPPFMAALFFATHPIHTEVVAWAGGIPELLFTLFYLLSFYFYIKEDEARGKWLILSLVFFSLSALSKETAITLPILLFAYDYSCKKEMALRAIIKRYSPYFILAGAYFILRTYAIGGFAPLRRHAELSGYEYFINVFPLFMQYIEKLILPINLNAFHVFHPIHSILEWKGIIAVSFTSAFIFLIYFSRNISRPVFFGLLCIALPLLPVLYIPALGENTFAERYLYLPSVGFVMLISITIEKIYRSPILARHGIVIILAVTVVAGLYSIGVIKRNYIWKDSIGLWTDTAKKSPDAPHAHYNLSVNYFETGRIEDAVEHLKIALRLRPDFIDAHNNLGNAYLRAGRIEDAVEHFEIAISLGADSSEPYYNLGIAYQVMGLTDKAIEHYEIALRFNPDDSEVHNNLGALYADRGLVDKAVEHYGIALRLKPDFPEAQDNLRKILENK